MQSYTPRFLWRSPSAMASNPVTPQSKPGGHALQDPFTEENGGDQEGIEKDGKEELMEREEKGHGSGEIPTLFYAYARRVRSF